QPATSRQNCATPVHRPNHAFRIRDRDMPLRNLLIAVRSNSGPICRTLICCAACNEKLRKNFLKFLCRILLPAGETSLRGLEVFYDCSGGNSRPSRLSGVGGGNFLGTERSSVSSCS